MPKPKASGLIPGAKYSVRLTNGAWVTAEFIRDIDPSWGSRQHYEFRNLASGRTVFIKSRVRIRECRGINTPSMPADSGFNPAR